MDKINKLEIKVAAIYKDLPHLPVEFQRWLSINAWWLACIGVILRSEEHTSELQSHGLISYAVFCLKKKKS